MNILVVDDELGLRHTLTLILQAEGHTVRAANDGASGLERLGRGTRGSHHLRRAHARARRARASSSKYKEMGGTALVIMMSAYGDDEAALEAIRRGAYDFIPKPFRADQVLLVVRKAIEREGLRREVAQLHDEIVALRAPTGIVGRSPRIAQALALADKVARHPSTVLITGESGTGKELIARHIHDASPRASRPFVAVNCAAIPEALLESELFGHAKGAFTGATAERQGLFEEAHDGTLFLDELGELPVPLQVKLLRALQEGEVRRVGDNASRSVDVRLVAATARDLEADVAEGKFRADLYYRINVVRIHLPALRERSEDVPELVRHFVDRFNRAARPARHRRQRRPRCARSSSIRGRATCASWRTSSSARWCSPTARSSAWSSSRRSPRRSTRSDAAASPLDLSVKRRTEELERALIKEALERTRGNRTRAAKLLDLSHRALLYKIRDYGLGE